MKLVTMAEIVLQRVGSLSGGGFGGQRVVTKTVVAEDESHKGLSRLIADIAESEGESVQLANLECVGWPHAQEPGLIVFDVRQPNVQHSRAYAQCRLFPALEIDGRYSRLEEVKG